MQSSPEGGAIQKSQLPFRGYVYIGTPFSDDDFYLLEISSGRKGFVTIFPLLTLVQNGTSCGGLRRGRCMMTVSLYLRATLRSVPTGTDSDITQETRW